MSSVSHRLASGVAEAWFENPERNEQPRDASREVKDEHRAGVTQAIPAANPRRRMITFAVIAMLLVLVILIVFWGLVHSDWLYGTYGQISQTNWDKITQIREELVRLKIAPDAVAVLDDALLLPHPSTEDVLYDLRRAILILDQYQDNASARRISDHLHALMAQIKPGYEWEGRASPTPQFSLPQY
jgi:hypothetical protein